MPPQLADPWLAARMHHYAAIRRAEAQLYPAIRDAADAYLKQARPALLGALTAAAAPRPDPPAGLPPEGVWRRLVERFVLPATRALWRDAFGRITRRDTTPTDTRDETDDGGHGAGLPERLAGFPRAVADRVRRALTLSQQRGETPAQLRARLAALMTLEEWEGQVLTMTRTETMTALNAGAAYGALTEQERTGQPWAKRWQSTPDARVRPTHRHADGQVRPLTEPFDVGEGRLQFPGDPRGPAGEILNCRCAARYGPAGDPALTAASAPREGHPMPQPTSTLITPDTDYRSVYTPDWHARALTASAAVVAVDEDGAWSGVLGYANEFSADQRMLRTPEGGYRSRPLPLPMLVQTELDDGHNKAKLGLSRLDRVWIDGEAIMGEGQFDMADPLAADIARKVSEGYMRFVSLDVDQGISREVCVDQDGKIQEQCDPRAPGVSLGTIYTDWRVMGLTLLAHPAFPNAFVSLKSNTAKLAAPTSQPFATGPAAEGQEIVGHNPEWGCVRPDGDAWTPADCADEGAVPANPDGTGPYQPEQEPAPEQDTAASDPGPAPDPAAEPEPEHERVPEGEDTGCVAPSPDADGWVPAPCDAPDAVPANADGTGPAEDEIQMAAAAPAPQAPADTSSGEAAGPTHAGIAVRAQDTGRVLLLQRALDEEDPAAGMWEFPGGGIEPGESPEDAAFREFAEETGIDLHGSVEVVDTWTSPNGVYQGFLATVPTEAEVGINPDPDERSVLNPDDPDHDNVEVVAWWDPAALPDMGSLREEVASDTPWEKITGAEDVAAQSTETEMSQPPAGCAPCRAVAITAAADTYAPGWIPPGEWFEQQPATEAHSIRVDVETGQLSGYLAPWAGCHVGFKDRCLPPPRSSTAYSYFNIRPVRTSTGTVYCGLITMNTGHAKITAAAPSALAHYDNTGTQAAVVRVGEDNHGIWVAGAVLPFLSKEDRLRLSLSSFSGDWREIRGGAELIAALAVNSPGFPLTAQKTSADGALFALVAAGFPPPGPDSPPALQADTSAPPEPGRQLVSEIVDSIVQELDARTAARLAYERRRASFGPTFAALRADLEKRTTAAAARRLQLARKRITGLQPQRKTETPKELAGLGPLPTPSNQDISLAKNWVDQQGGLPAYIKRISKHLTDKGMDKSRAIATAVNVAKKMCASGDTNWPGVQHVNAGSQAEACKAVEEWNAKKAAAHAS